MERTLGLGDTASKPGCAVFHLGCILRSLTLTCINTENRLIEPLDVPATSRGIVRYERVITCTTN